MASTIYYRIISEDVISEIIDGEVMIINLENGFYFSMEEVGSAIWGAIELGNSFEQIVAAVNNRYKGDPHTIETGVRQIINQLLEEGLISTSNVPFTEMVGEKSAPNPEDITDKAQYVEPSLNKYTDMEDLLLLDPVHEVGDTGWPNTQQEDE